MAYLHNGNFQPTTVFSFYPCGNDSIYLEGLKEGELILSETPYFYQNANGFLAIDDRFTSFIITKNEKSIQTINLEWKNSCMEKTQVVPIVPVVPGVKADPIPSGAGWNALMVLSIGIVTIILARRFFREHR